MKTRVSLVLVEQLIMLLVFSLSSAICLGIFVEGYKLHRQAEDLDAAVLLAQNAAEILKASKGDLSETAQVLGCGYSETELTASFTSPVNAVRKVRYLLHIRKTAAPLPFLGMAEIRVTDANSPDQTLFTLNVAWQEADP